VSVLALVDQVLEHALYRGEVGHSRLDLVEPALCEGPCAHVAGAVVELQQHRDVVEREAERLGTLDEAQPVDVRWRVEPLAPVGLRRGAEQLAPLVVANGLDADPGRGRQLADFQRFHGPPLILCSGTDSRLLAVPT
jgi:hypothetical protein